MWGPLMAGAVVTAFNPVHLAIVALVISRPRPVRSLFAFWVGALVAGVPSLLLPLVLLHSTPAVVSMTANMADTPTFRHVQIGLGAVALSVALLLVIRSSTREREGSVTSGAGPATQEARPSVPRAMSWLLNRDDGGTSGDSAIRRVLCRAQRAWDDGSLWIAGLVGMLMGGPSVDGVIMALALIVTSGTALGTQVVAAVSLLFAILLVVEVILVSSVIAPAKTRTALTVVHDWVQTHRRQIMIGLFIFVGLALIAQGLAAS